MSIDISNVSYLCFRLAPFIIVCYFVLQSILNWDLKGLIYLVGLLFSSVLLIMLNGPMKYLFQSNFETSIANPKCIAISIGENGNMLSNIPLSISVYSYTFFYLLTFIISLGAEINTSLQQNIPLLILFPSLILLEYFWLSINNCVIQPYFYITCSIVVSSLIGVCWSMIIISVKNNDLMYTSKNGIESCSRPSKTLFKCKPRK